MESVGATIGIWTVLTSAFYAAGCLLAARSLIHWFQLESYQHPGFFRTIRRKGIHAWLPGILMAGAAAFLFWMDGLLHTGIPIWIRSLLLSFFLIAAGYGIRQIGMRQKEKKKLVYTARIKRLYAISLIIFCMLILILFSISGSLGINPCIPASVFALFLPVWVALGGLIAWPVEKGISEMYFRDAQRILREHGDLIRIGITGSWGKTSVKFILGTLLSEKYPTLVTPSSYNTPMGVTKVIRSSLEPGHRIFVAEMGARHVGDIKEMCRLVSPVMGVLTSVGPQHLDTFHTQERITRTKYELMEAIPENGSCFFADDGGIVTELWKKTAKEKYLAGMDASRDDVWAEELVSTPEGSRFLLCTANGKFPSETELLGELNIRNIVLCASVCLKLGMTEKEILRGIRKLKPVEHRLELKRNPGGINVLDDAFNSNIRGARQAFQVLKDFPGKRIIVTPGMVELGDLEDELNREFGLAMAGCCDEAVLVGRKRSEALSYGLKEGGFSPEKIHVTGSLDEAAELLKNLVSPGDTVLFENDLPDNYSEG